MTETEILVWGLIGTLVVTVIIGVPAWRRNRKHETIDIAATLDLAGEMNILEKFGCGGLRLTVVGKGKRPAKIKGADLCLKGFDALPKFQELFGNDFKHVPVPGAPEPVFRVGFEPISTDNPSDGWVLERDDVCRFLVAVDQVLTMFADAPSQDVSVVVTFLDGSEQVVQRGLIIQTHLRGLLEGSDPTAEPSRIPLRVRIDTTSGAPPDLPSVGTTSIQ